MELAVSGNEEEREEATAELIAVTMKKAEGREEKEEEKEILSN